MRNCTVELVPIFDNNYVFLIQNEKKQALIVDPGEPFAVLKIIAEKGLDLQAVLVTHHHSDHIGGLEKIKNNFKNLPIYAPLKNKEQISLATHFLNEGDSLQIAGFDFKVFELPGHTMGHIAYFESTQNWLFSGDVLFGLGCGRLFEGSFEQAWQSLNRLKTLPKLTQIFCAHEYSEDNLKFCQKMLEQKVIDLNFEDYTRGLKALRQAGKPSVPLHLGSELQFNPFLRAENLAKFTELRTQRNAFKVADM